MKALVEGSIKILVLVSNYYDDEVNDRYKLVSFLHVARKIDMSTTKIGLNNLNHESMNEFLADTLNVSQFELCSLTTFVHKKLIVTLTLQSM